MIRAVHVIVALYLLAMPALADSPTCYPSDRVQAMVKDLFGEEPVMGGQVGGGPITVGIYANTSTGSWTMVYTNAGVSCIVGVGLLFTIVPQGDPA